MRIIIPENPIVTLTMTLLIFLALILLPGAGVLIAFVVGWLIGGFIEEIVFRGYLLTRLRSIFGKASLVDFLIITSTSAVFGFSHLYQGWTGVISTGMIAFIFGYIFVINRMNLWYPILNHGFVNTVGSTLIYLDLDLDKVLSSL